MVFTAPGNFIYDIQQQTLVNGNVIKKNSPLLFAANEQLNKGPQKCYIIDAVFDSTATFLHLALFWYTADFIVKELHKISLSNISEVKLTDAAGL